MEQLWVCPEQTVLRNGVIVPGGHFVKEARRGSSAPLLHRQRWRDFISHSKKRGKKSCDPLSLQDKEKDKNKSFGHLKKWFVCCKPNMAHHYRHLTIRMLQHAGPERVQKCREMLQENHRSWVDLFLKAKICSNVKSKEWHKHYIEVLVGPSLSLDLFVAWNWQSFSCFVKNLKNL